MNKFKAISLLILMGICVCGMIFSKEESIDVSAELSDDNNTKIILYFLDLDSGELKKEYRYVEIDDVKNNISKTIVDELLRGPSDDTLISEIPDDTNVNDIKINEGKITIDFSKEFLKGDEDEFKKYQKIYQVVNSLTEIKEIDEVEITVEGKEYITRERI